MKNVLLLLEPRGTSLWVAAAARRRGLLPVGVSCDPGALAWVPEVYRQGREALESVVSVPHWGEGEEVRKILEGAGFNPGTVAGIHYSMDATAEVSAALRTWLGLPTPTVEAFRGAIHKGQMRQKLVNAGLSRLRSYSAKDLLDGGQWPFPGRAYVKPALGCFSADVAAVDGLEALRLHLASVETGSERDPRWVKEFLARGRREFIVEEAHEGELLSVESIATKGGWRSLGLLSRILYSQNPVVEMGSVFPYPHPRALEIEERVRRVHECLGLSWGACHTEIIVDGEQQIEVIDINPRVVGADVVRSLGYAYGFPFEEVLLDLALGREPQVGPFRNRYAALQYVLPPEPLTFASLELPQDALYGAVFPKAGQSVGGARQLDYLGCYLVGAPSFAEALERVRALRDSVRVNGQRRGAF